MVALPAIAAPDPTLDAIDRAVEAREAAIPARGYLGMSQIGEPCERRLWYSFRWAFQRELPADALYRIEDGHRTEDVLAARLRLVPGVQLHTIDPRTGQQVSCSDHGGHFRGHLDGVVLGLLQAPKTWHVWESKAVDPTKQAKLAKLKAVDEKAALAAWDPIYWAQAVVYMDYTGLDRHYLSCASPGGRTTVTVRTDADPAAAATLREKARRVITADGPLPRLSEDPAFWQCKGCPAQAVCHGKTLPPVSCRTCAHATPALDGDGRWTCARWTNEDIPLDAQRTGCDEHRYIPALVTWAEQIDADVAANWIEYRLPDGRTFRNGAPDRGCYTSPELRAIDPALIGDAVADDIRATFDARVVEPGPDVPALAPLPPMSERPFRDLSRPQPNWRAA